MFLCLSSTRWMQGLVSTAKQHVLEKVDVPDLVPGDKTAYWAAQFELQWKREVAEAKARGWQPSHSGNEPTAAEAAAQAAAKEGGEAPTKAQKAKATALKKKAVAERRALGKGWCAHKPPARLLQPWGRPRQRRPLAPTRRPLVEPDYIQDLPLELWLRGLLQVVPRHHAGLSTAHTAAPRAHAGAEPIDGARVSTHFPADPPTH